MLADSEGTLSHDAECECLLVIESESSHDGLQTRVNVTVVGEEDMRLAIDRFDEPQGKCDV